ncbi:hypothetical protein D0T11_06040 [Hymenobacter rubripertinctus]|uniref:Toxin-antitoxin system YwqK family antitoxin n=2 Tax=Hymenobacter rubripertinctus TaxID=2029981 RepID=A0A418R424_9BACT|nr:hypothetical protein D0T11_06040 [Hymenobacter rubripertinctus]
MSDLKDCYRIVQEDSVVVYYDADYVLTPSECASIRRHTRLTADGNFGGEVRDYWINTNQLALRVRYQDGKSDGLIEQYHFNGRLALRGQLLQGIPSGEWQYWYTNGQRRQTARFSAENTVYLVAYWDSTGTQQVANGTGYWEGELAPTYTTMLPGNIKRNHSTLRFKGSVADGVPHGEWQSIYAHNKQVFTVENFARGKFRHGRMATKPVYGSATLTASQIIFALASPSKLAEDFELGLSCATRQQQQQNQKVLAQIRFPSNTSLPPDYAEQLGRKLMLYAGQPWYERLPARSALRCQLDSTGSIQEVSGDNAPLQAVIRDAMRLMPRWSAATYQGHYIPGGFTVVVVNNSGSLTMQLYVTATVPAESAGEVREYWQYWIGF